MSFSLRLHGGQCEQYDLGARIGRGASRQCGLFRETLLDVTSSFAVDDRRHILEGLSEGVAVAATEKGNGSKESGHAQELQERVASKDATMFGQDGVMERLISKLHLRQGT